MDIFKKVALLEKELIVFYIDLEGYRDAVDICYTCCKVYLQYYLGLMEKLSPEVLLENDISRLFSLTEIEDLTTLVNDLIRLKYYTELKESLTKEQALEAETYTTHLIECLEFNIKVQGLNNNETTEFINKD